MSDAELTEWLGYDPTHVPAVKVMADIAHKAMESAKRCDAATARLEERERAVATVLLAWGK